MQMQIKYIVNHDYFLFVSFDDIDIIDRKAYMHLLLIHLYAFLSRVSMLKHHWMYHKIEWVLFKRQLSQIPFFHCGSFI